MVASSGSQEFEGATFVKTSFRSATLRSCDVSGVTMCSVDVGGLDIDSHDLFFGTLIVNGVDVVPFVEAELNRRFPGRELQKAQTPEGLRDGWVAVQAAWETTVATTPPDLVNARVDDEWSLAQTLRHLVLATDAWLAEERDDPWGGADWRPTVGDCVRVILEEEWAHLRYIRRDLSLLGCYVDLMPWLRGNPTLLVRSVVVHVVE